MASIESLLNPLPDLRRFQLPSPSLTSYTRDEASSPSLRPKRQKIAKDAPIFRRGKIRGELRYPPCEDRDEELVEMHRKFEIHPMGHIAEFPRHIPYNSEKKSFQEKTGRESFEVFQYTFKIPGEEKTWTVMWDYNIGLVRTTHLFKCNDYSKTTPAKMLNANPGLRDICHSITGGALAAQGYWMPFEAAKAVAATFCWRIRHALTPLFGLDFPSMCIPPEDRARFGRMIIDAAIVQKATESANHYRLLEKSARSHLRTPSTPGPSSSFDQTGKNLIPRIRRRAETVVNYETDSDMNDDKCFCTPPTPYRNSFTPVNTPRDLGIVRHTLPSPRDILESMCSISKTMEEDDPNDSDIDSTSSSEGARTRANSMSPDVDVDDDDDDDSDYRGSEDVESSSSMSSDGELDGSAERESMPMFLTREMKAAHALLSLHLQDTVLDECDSLESGEQGTRGRERKRRRASA
ncbi:hypothetical protein VTN02DRAFT_2506 [Thermoascus thermophilus]